MDMPALLAKIAGLILLAWTVMSIVKHVKLKRAERKTQKETQSVTEQMLNNALLYLWLAFMLVFSSGMIINN